MLNYLLIMIFVKIEVKYNMNFISTTPISLMVTREENEHSPAVDNRGIDECNYVILNRLVMPLL